MERREEQGGGGGPVNRDSARGVARGALLAPSLTHDTKTEKLPASEIFQGYPR